MLGSQTITPLRTILLNSLNHIDRLDRSVDDLYDKEFQDLKQFSEGLKTSCDYTCSEGEKEINRKKNRYKDILPFNTSRVILKEINGTNGSNYVNANYIRGASGSPAYIASQGPLPNTVNDFWRMVVECEVQVIVMACNAQESGKHKCENYWVEREGEERSFGNIDIRLIKAKVICPDFLVRTMQIRYTDDKNVTEERTVCQFHYSAWPDHGVPPLVRPLLDMVRLVRDTQASETLPVLVHCSAGCGRTGTICAIDFVWGLLRLGKLRENFSLFNLVRDMRKQRVAMVQTKEQYVLVHHCVRELFKEQLHLIDSHTYANVDLNGRIQPIYETLNFSKCNGEEKQDCNKLDELDVLKLDYMEKLVAPPLPKKKCAVASYSKQEKEVENQTEKNRITSALKSVDDVDGSVNNSLVRRPKIAKLKALFERSSSNGEKIKSHTVSRSHSLGPIRKPLLAELITHPVEEVKQKQPVEPAIRSGGKLRVPKLIGATAVITRPQPQVKRSKSLKVAKDSTPFLKLLQYASADELIDQPSTHPMASDTVKSHFNENPVKKQSQEILNYSENSRRRRSLESLLGGDAPDITWTSTVCPPQEKSGTLQQIVEPNKTKSALSFRQQFQILTNASQRTMSSLASGLGIRERRNSFRQAVSKEDSHERITGFGSEGRFISVPEETATVLVDGTSKDYRETLTVKNHNGEILRAGFKATQQSYSRLQRQPESHNSFGITTNQGEFKEPRITSQSMRISSKNRFLSKLKTELQSHSQISDNNVLRDRNTNGRFFKLQEVGTVHESLTNAPMHFSSEKNKDTSKNEHKNRSSYFSSMKGFRRPTQSSSTNGPQINNSSDAELRYSSSSKASKNSTKTSLVSVPPEQAPHYHRSSRGEKPRRKTQPYVSSDDTYVSLYQTVSHEGNSTSSPLSSLSSDNLSSYARKSNISSLSDDSTIRHAELSRTNLERLRLILDRNKQDYGSESSSSSGARELHAVMRLKSADFESQNASGKSWAPALRSKSTPQTGEIVKPIAPPRVRRRGSEIVSRHSVHDPLDGQFTHWSPTNDSRHWNGAIGVDLDAVAASIQRQKDGLQSVDGALNVDTEQSMLAVRKHQYL